MPFHLLLEGSDLGLEVFDCGHEVGWSLEGFRGAAEEVALGHGPVDGTLAGFGLDPTDARRHSTFARDAEQADFAGCADVGAPAEFDARPESDHPNGVSVLLAKEHHGAGSLGFLEGNALRRSSRARLARMAG